MTMMKVTSYNNKKGRFFHLIVNLIIVEKEFNFPYIGVIVNKLRYGI